MQGCQSAVKYSEKYSSGIWSSSIVENSTPTGTLSSNTEPDVKDEKLHLSSTSWSVERHLKDTDCLLCPRYDKFFFLSPHLIVEISCAWSLMP